MVENTFFFYDPIQSYIFICVYRCINSNNGGMKLYPYCVMHLGIFLYYLIKKMLVTTPYMILHATNSIAWKTNNTLDIPKSTIVGKWVCTSSTAMSWFEHPTLPEK